MYIVQGVPWNFLRSVHVLVAGQAERRNGKNTASICTAHHVLFYSLRMTESTLSLTNTSDVCIYVPNTICVYTCDAFNNIYRQMKRKKIHVFFLSFGELPLWLTRDFLLYIYVLNIAYYLLYNNYSIIVLYCIIIHGANNILTLTAFCIDLMLIMS